MTYYDDIYDFAIDEHYLITTAEARSLGIPTVELAKLAHRGRLEHLGNGVYRLARHVASPADPYAIAVKRAGQGAFLYGESVLALLDLAPTNPLHIYVATAARVRRSLPAGIVVVKVRSGAPVTTYEGIRCQIAAEAIRTCRGMMMPERLRMAAEEALAQGYLSQREFDSIMEEIACWRRDRTAEGTSTWQSSASPAAKLQVSS